MTLISANGESELTVPQMMLSVAFQWSTGTSTHCGGARALSKCLNTGWVVVPANDVKV
jgi:hypothetical protein